jgi:membrane associated rhomboid family serine protease
MDVEGMGVGAGRTMGADAGVSALFGAVCWGWRSTELNLVVLRVRGLSLLLFFVALDVLRVVALGQVEAFASLGGVAMGIVVIDDVALVAPTRSASSSRAA